MPVEDGYGYGEHTALKAEHFDKFMRMHLRLCLQVYNSKPFFERKYRYFDLTAGPGVKNGEDQTAMKYVKAVRESCLPHDSWLFERSLATCETLRTAVGLSLDFHVTNADHLAENGKALLASLRSSMPFENKWLYLGLLYYDVTPCKEQFSTLRLLGDLSTRENMQRIDYLFYLSPAKIKQMKLIDGAMRLGDVIGNIAKKCWLIREPAGNDQWTFLCGTNYADMKEYAAIGFHRLDSQKGKAVFNRLAFTPSERKEAAAPATLFPVG